MKLQLKLPGGSEGKESACNVGNSRFNPWVGKIPLEKEMATHSSILAWRIPWTERRLTGYSPWGRKRVGHDLATEQKPTQDF